MMAMTGMRREKVYDPILRVIHAWNALALLLLLAASLLAQALPYTPEAVFLWRFHVWTGYALTVGLVARLAWGINGPRHARFAAMWRWRDWLAAARRRQFFTAPSDWGHHPLAAAVYLLFYLLLIVMVITGLALAAIEQGQGPLARWLAHEVALAGWLRTPHDILEDFLIGFVVIHVAALILHESRHGVPVAQAMVSGYQYRKDEE